MSGSIILPHWEKARRIIIGNKTSPTWCYAPESPGVFPLLVPAGLEAELIGVVVEGVGARWLVRMSLP